MDPLIASGLGSMGTIVAGIIKNAVLSGSKELVQRFFKDSVERLGGNERQLNRAVVQSLRYFLESFQSELEHTEAFTFLRQEFETSLKLFLAHPEVLRTLGDALEVKIHFLNVEGLRNLWEDLSLPPLPSDFDWDVVCANYLRDVRREFRHDAELRAVLSTDNLAAARDALEDIAGVVPGFDVRGYRDAIVKMYEHLKLDTLDISGQDYRVKLRNVFVPQDVRETLPFYDLPQKVLSQLQDDGAIERGISLEEWATLKQRYLSCPLLSVESVLADSTHRHFVLLGDAGSGKSSLAQNVLLKWTENPKTPMVFLIELRGYAQDLGNPNTFLKYLESGEGCIWLFSQRQTDEWLRTRETLVIFEGLDEVFDPVRRHETTRAILRFAVEYPKARVMVTSRTVGYNAQDLRSGGFKHFTLQDFSDTQIDRFLARWHDEAIASPGDREMLGRRLRESLSESSSLRELAGNPLLLTMLAILNRNQELPRDRADAYEQMSRVLLHQWDVNKFLRERAGQLGDRIGRHEKQELLRRIAFNIQADSESQVGNLITRPRLEEVIITYLRDVVRFDPPESGARLIIQQLRERNFVLCPAGADYFAFVHRTFLEYYCASAFVARFYETLSLDRLRQETFEAHWEDVSWREILKLISGMIPTTHASNLIEWLLHKERRNYGFENVFLAADCWKELADATMDSPLGRSLWHHLVNVADFRPKGAAFDNTGIVDTRQEARRISALQIRIRAIVAIGSTFPNDDRASAWLKDAALNRANWAMRQAAIRTLGKGWRQSSDMRDWLIKFATTEDNHDVREAAVHEIARGWRRDPTTRDWLKSLGETDKHSDIRGTAVQELARGWADDPASAVDVRDWLISTAITDEVEYVQVTALKEIAQGWKNDPYVMDWLKSLAENGEESTLKDFAARELVRAAKT